MLQVIYLYVIIPRWLQAESLRLPLLPCGLHMKMGFQQIRQEPLHVSTMKSSPPF